MGWIGLIEPILKLLKGAGILKDPQVEAQIRKDLALAEAQQDQAFADYIKATTPSWDRVYPFVNSLIALVRPFLAVFVPVTWVLFPERWREVLEAYRHLDAIGKFMVAAPTVIFVGGRDLMRMFVGLLMSKTGAGAEALRNVLPPGVPPPSPRRTPVAEPPEEPPIRGFEMPEPDEPQVPERLEFER